MSYMVCSPFRTCPLGSFLIGGHKEGLVINFPGKNEGWSETSTGTTAADSEEMEDERIP
jgi:hypothetical protein